MTTAERIAPYTLRRLIEENEAIRAQAARLSHWESAIGAVMMPDLKDWHDNDPKEWPDVAAAVIRTLREQRDEEVELSGRLSAENEALRAKNEELTGKTDDLTAKSEELHAQVEALHLRLMTAEDGAKEAARAEEIYVKAERLLTADERSLHDEVVKLRAQVEALQKAAEHLPWIGHGADWTEAKPVYLVATGEVNEGQETCTRHDAPVPLADQEVLFTRPPEPLVRPAVTRDQIREVFMRCGFTIKEGQTDLKQYVYDAIIAMLAAAPQPEVNQPPSPSAEDWLRKKYGAYRGHPEWRALEAAFNAGMAVQKGGA